MTGHKLPTSTFRSPQAEIAKTADAVDAGPRAPRSHEDWVLALNREEILTKRDARFRANSRALAILIIVAIDLFSGTASLLHRAADAVSPQIARENPMLRDPVCPPRTPGSPPWIARENSMPRDPGCLPRAAGSPPWIARERIACRWVVRAVSEDRVSLSVRGQEGPSWRSLSGWICIMLRSATTDVRAEIKPAHPIRQSSKTP